jgi:hypothetical protein
MRRIIATIVGAIVAVSLAITSVVIIGLIAMAVIIIVWLLARRPRSAVRRD